MGTSIIIQSAPLQTALVKPTGWVGRMYSGGWDYPGEAHCWQVQKRKNVLCQRGGTCLCAALHRKTLVSSNWATVWRESDIPNGSKQGENLQKQMEKVHTRCPYGLYQVTATSWDQNWPHLIFTSSLTRFALQFPVHFYF